MDKTRILAEWTLVRQYQEGDESAFRTLLVEQGIYDVSGWLKRDHDNYVYRYFTKLWLTRRDPESFAQEVVSRLATALKRFRFESTVKTFIYRICSYVYLEEARKIKGREFYVISIFAENSQGFGEDGAPREVLEKILSDDATLDKIIAEERQELIRTCLARLANNNMRLVASLRLEGLKFKQIAEKLDRKLGNVNAWWSRALARLRKCVFDLESEENGYALSPGR